MTPDTAIDTDALSLAILRLVGDFPGQHGRIRTARIVGGYEVDWVSGYKYAVATSWTLAPIVELIETLIGDGFLARTPGSRPYLVLTRTGHRALDALT